MSENLKTWMWATYTPRQGVYVECTSQWNGEKKLFTKGEIRFQIEGASGKWLSVRGKYPEDEWFGICELSDLLEVTQ